MPSKKPTTKATTPKTATPKKAAAPRKPAARKPKAEETTAIVAKPKREPYTGPRSGNLIIVESPAKAKTIEKYLGSGYRVRASYGHVRDLPVSGKVRGEEVVGITIGSDWNLRYQIIERTDKGGKGRRSTQDIIDELRSESDKAEMVYLATDPDREGESIAWHIEEELQLDPNRTRRITFNEITKKAVQDALKNARAIDQHLVDAQEARRAMDRVVGYPLSNLLSKKITRGLSAGRVQSVAVRVVVDREREIEAFKTEEYWRINALLSVPTGPKSLVGFTFPAKVLAKKKGAATGPEKLTDEQRAEDPEGAETSEAEDTETTGDATAKAPTSKIPAGSFIAELAQWQGKPFASSTEEATDAIYAQLDLASYKITKVEQKDRNDNAQPPFTTSSLQQQASIRLRMSAQRTMQTAQKLYEGVTLGKDGLTALITYMRTDSTRVSDDALKMVREHVENVYGPKYLPAKPNFFKSGKSAQEAHEAIRPTDLSFTPQRVANFLDPDQLRLYTLIYNRFVASQMAAAVVAVTNVEIEAGQGLFKAKGQIEKFDGYRKVWPAGKQEDVMLPALAENMLLNKLGLSATQHFTQPPSRYNEASLVKMLEKEGIGRPSTYATIISTITKKGYVDLDQRRFKATELGKTVTDLLVKGFPSILDVKFTSHFEEELDEIANGKLKSNAVLNEFWAPFKDALTHADTALPKAKGRETGEACPRCNRPLVEMYSAKLKGSFVGCSGWNAKEEPCSYIKPREGEPEPVDIKVNCPTCTLPMVQRSSRWGAFLSCTGYKADGSGCNTICNLGENNEVIITCKKTDFPCPKCTKPLLWRKGKSAPYFTCSDSACKTTLEADKTGLAPQPPMETGINCDKCQSAMVIKKGWRGPFLSCSGYPKCRNAKPLTKELKEKFKDMLPPPPEKKKLPEIDIKDVCPECGSPLKLCEARGRYFLGCSVWAQTKCKGSKQLTPEQQEQLNKVLESKGA